jgi:hypothetical protein
MDFPPPHYTLTKRSRCSSSIGRYHSAGYLCQTSSVAFRCAFLMFLLTPLPYLIILLNFQLHSTVSSRPVSLKLLPYLTTWMGKSSQHVRRYSAIWLGIVRASHSLDLRKLDFFTALFHDAIEPCVLRIVGLLQNILCASVRTRLRNSSNTVSVLSSTAWY